jgi:hypothetical protein
LLPKFLLQTQLMCLMLGMPVESIVLPIFLS